MSRPKKAINLRRPDAMKRPERLNTKQEKAAFDAALNALCLRLGISDDVPYIHKLTLIGIKLAFEQPEFTEKPRKGRPRSKNGGVDYQRALVIRNLRREAVAAGLNAPILSIKSAA